MVSEHDSTCYVPLQVFDGVQQTMSVTLQSSCSIERHKSCFDSERNCSEDDVLAHSADEEARVELVKAASSLETLCAGCLEPLREVLGRAIVHETAQGN